MLILLTKEEATVLREILEEWYRDHRHDIMDFRERRREEEVYEKVTILIKRYLGEL